MGIIVKVPGKCSCYCSIGEFPPSNFGRGPPDDCRSKRPLQTRPGILNIDFVNPRR